MDQFTRLRDGDCFWYQNTMTAAEQLRVGLHTLAAIIRRNTGIGSEIGFDVFTTQSP